VILEERRQALSRESGFQFCETARTYTENHFFIRDRDGRMAVRGQTWN